MKPLEEKPLSRKALERRMKQLKRYRANAQLRLEAIETQMAAIEHRLANNIGITSPYSVNSRQWAAKRRRTAWGLWLQGLTNKAIARHLGISAGRVTQLRYMSMRKRRAYFIKHQNNGRWSIAGLNWAADALTLDFDRINL